VPAFSAPLHPELDPEAAAARADRLARETRCTCPTPLCRGQDSADWLTCERACRACRPRPFQPPTRAPALVGDAGGTPEGADGG
jgi:hypothetical protein